jgi:hypothetical protein
METRWSGCNPVARTAGDSSTKCLIGIDLQGLREGRNDTACPEECDQNKFL